MKKILVSLTTFFACIFFACNPAFCQNQKSYTLVPTENNVKTETSITLFHFNEETSTLEKKYYELKLTKTNYGEGENKTTISAETINNKTENITANYKDSDYVNLEKISTGNYVYGGALYHFRKTTETISENFIENKATSVSQDADGGALNNYYGTITNLESDFINNSANSTSNDARGGAIDNRGTIANLTGDFINNTSNSQTGAARGGAIVNHNTITTLNGNFINNSANSDSYLSYGGAIYNIFGTITDLNGDFINNSVNSNTGQSYGGAICIEQGIINNINGDFINNTTIGNFGTGGAIHSNGTIGNINGNFINNTAKSHNGASIGGAINNRGTIASLTGDFINNNVITEGKDTWGYAGAIYNYGPIGTIVGNFIKNSVIANNSSSVEGGALSNLRDITKIKADFIDNSAIATNKAYGGAIYNTGTIHNLSGNFIGNKAVSETGEAFGGAIYNTRNINIYSEEEPIIFRGNTDSFGYSAIYNNNGEINLNSNSAIIFDDKITGEGTRNKININATNEEYIANGGTSDITLPNLTSGTIAINNEIRNSNVNMFNGTLLMGSNTQNNEKFYGTFDSDSCLNFYGGNLSLQNNEINSANLGNLSLYNDIKLSLDVDLANEKIDTITANTFASNENKINITNLNLLSATKATYLSLSPLGDMNEEIRNELSNSIIYTGGDVAYGKIYKYNVDYDPINSVITLGLQGGGKNLDNFVPSATSVPIAQSAIQGAQVESYMEAFRNMDMFMIMPEAERIAIKHRNKYATTSENIVYDPTMNAYHDDSFWLRPHTTFENVPLKNGPKIDNISYGTYFGYDSKLKELGHGWDGTFGIYAGYNGSHQNYHNNSVQQNGGTLGLISVLYKNNLFSGWTISTGASNGRTSNSQGSDSFTSLISGVSNKTGYNFEFFDGKFILQPNLVLSYIFVNTFDYTNTMGAKIKSDPMHTLQIEPSIKLIGNINSWQPYANVSMVWNLLNETKVTADNVRLPDVSIKPYVKYGLGLQKKWGDKFTGYGQAYVTNGGRNGVGLQFGFRISIGEKLRKAKAKAQQLKAVSYKKI